MRSFCLSAEEFSKPLIASGVKVALGAPCFFGSSDGVGVGEFSGGVVVGDGVSLGDVDLAGVSEASGAGEDFFFFRGDSIGEGDGEAFFFLAGGGESASSSADKGFFFFGDGVTDGVAASSSFGSGDVFFFGEALAVGDGDVFFSADECFFLRGVGVGVGVEKIFLIAAPIDCSAAPPGTIDERINASVINSEEPWRKF